MLGTQIMVAPIVVKRTTKRSVLLPPGKWTHAFTKQEYKIDEAEGTLLKFTAPIGEPLVFVTGDN